MKWFSHNILYLHSEEKEHIGVTEEANMLQFVCVNGMCDVMSAHMHEGFNKTLQSISQANKDPKLSGQRGVSLICVYVTSYVF